MLNAGIMIICLGTYCICYVGHIILKFVSDDFMGQFDIQLSDVQEEITRKFGAATGFFQKWYPLQPRGGKEGKEDGEITGDILLKLELISQNTDEVFEMRFYSTVLNFLFSH